MNFEELIEEIGEYFWEAGISYCTEMEFRSPKNAIDYDEVLKKYKEMKGFKDRKTRLSR